ncbi:glutamate receptor ionotropic [Striga asiatica]|uniref:Glutamate receptor ionotropic n=1 Tax=Striga asiatica TaxID=4170 RepID=A0A5A7QHA9_STRAF|nr:glutamate receptor ionotropic [Striga asiatica]
MEAALELDDDIFFKDLSKQISLLIMDDDDPLAQHPSVNLQALAQSIHPARQEPPFIDYYHQQMNKNESKGTGVFIPRSSQFRRKNAKQGKRFITAASGNKSQMPFDHNSRGISSISYSNNIDNPSSHDHHYSVNHKRF